MSSKSIHSCVGVSEVDMTPPISVRDPVGVAVTKGRPKSAGRMKSFLEVNMSSGGKKKKTCSYRHGLGHYKIDCPKKKVDDNQCPLLLNKYKEKKKSRGRSLLYTLVPY